jgi:micrococcal nuclease
MIVLITGGCNVQTDKVETDTSTDPISCLKNIKPESAKVVEVVDGDTIIIEINGHQATLRYLGIDTPEISASDPKPGETARNLNQSFVGGKNIEIYRDVDDRDDFGRLLRFVIVDGKFINYEMVKSGNATTFIRLPNVVCSLEMKIAMLNAYETRTGIWQNVDSLYSYTGANKCTDGCEKRKADCLIKGNVNSSGDQIYHLPGEENYDEIGINPEKGERWFCTIGEAISNGWRPQRVE